MADPVDAAKNAAKDVASKATGALKWGFNQVSPLPGGKLSRNLMLLSTTALVGSVIATGGLAGPAALGGQFATAVGTGVSEIFNLGVGVATGANWGAAQASATALGSALTAGMAPV